MRREDVPDVDRLRDQAGWNQTHNDWRRLLAWQPEGCFVAEDEAEVVASVTTTPYAGPVGSAWLGMLLVDETRRRQGIARRMLSHAVTWLLEHGVNSVALDATPLGKTLYDQTGFSDVYTLQRWRGVAPVARAPQDEGLRRLQPTDIPRIREMDSAAFFGLDRGYVLRDLCAAHPAGCFVKNDLAGNVEGYVLSRRGARSWYIGPLVALHESVADMLLRAALESLAHESVTIDTVGANPCASELVREHGFAPVRPFIRMLHGTPLAQSRTDWYFAMAGPEIG